MIEQRKPRPALIVDPDPNFLQTLRSDPRANHVPPLIAASGKEAQLQLANPNILLSGVFVNPSIADPNGFSVIRFSHQYRPATPIFVIHDGDSTLTKDDLNGLGIQQALKKPLNYTQIMELITPTALLFDAEDTLELSKKFQDKLGTELTAEDMAFIPIRAADFLSGSKCFFDVYVRLGSGRYVKILQAGDSFTYDRISSYLTKGVTHFHLRKESQERYLAYCDKLTSALIQNIKAPVSIKISQTLNHGEETMNFLRKNGLSETNLQYAANFIGNVETLTGQLNQQQNNAFGDFLSDLAAYEHGVATAMIAALLIHPLKIAASQPVKIIGIGSLLHDIGLYRMDEALREEDESQMTPEQVKIYQTHPTVGAEILKGMRGVDPVVAQAVAQHHERRNKKGFPLRLGAGSINRVAEIIGLADELARRIEKAKKDPAINPLQDLELTMVEGFSNPVVEAFRKVFNRSEEKN